MKEHMLYTVASLLTMLLLMFHHADDLLRGKAPGGLVNIAVILILVLWLYATVMLAERRSGYVIILLGSILGSGIPIIHMRGTGLGGAVAKSGDDPFFFVWTLLALGVTATFSIILSARGLWSLQRGAIDHGDGARRR